MRTERKQDRDRAERDGIEAEIRIRTIQVGNPTKARTVNQTSATNASRLASREDGELQHWPITLKCTSGLRLNTARNVTFPPKPNGVDNPPYKNGWKRRNGNCTGGALANKTSPPHDSASLITPHLFP